MGRKYEGGRSTLLLTFWLFAMSYRRSSAEDDISELNYEKIFDKISCEDGRYNCKTRPFIGKDIPVKVNTSIFLYSMTSVNELHTEYTIQMLYRQRWQDPRLDFTNISDIRRIVGDHWHAKRIWIPSVHVVNNKEIGSLSRITEGAVLVHIYRNGTVVMSNRVHMRPLCKMEFYRYPLDKQVCTLEIESSTLSPYHLTLHWEAVDPILLSNHFYVTGYDLTNYSTTTTQVKYRHTGNFSKIIVEFQLQREFGHFLLDIYIPGMLFVVTSWTSFWVEIPAAPARVTLGITTMLTLITSEKSVREKLPKMSYVHALDIWNVVCTAFIFASLVEYAMVNYIYHKDKRRKQGGMKRVDSSATFASMETDTTSVFSIFKNVFKSEQKESSPGLPTSISLHDFQSLTNQPSPEIGCGPWPLPKLRPQDIANGIDRKCRIIFPVGFLMFNVVYWTVLWV
ncbi:glycine receptor subunit alpha-2-like [Centruroides vittatus]|uniref:glycine receptor subunit alpha-2-like n=1 Tax=Centruroides vittatus TaxID=120091 RepID=UPI00350FA532